LSLVAFKLTRDVDPPAAPEVRKPVRPLYDVSPAFVLKTLI
jgi:hypothetical protein